MAWTEREEQLRNQIDHMDYESLLRKWRNAPAGDPFFQGETGAYYREVMNRKRNEVGQEEHVRASKQIGWDG